MTNDEIAAILSQIADHLEENGENTYKVRAYRNAVRTIDTLEEPLAEIEARGELSKLPGFGETMVTRTREILQMGTSPLLEQMRSEAVRPILTPAEMHDSEEDEIPSPW